MATGVPAIDALFAAGRGIVAIPEAVRQEGVQGVAKGFLNPKPYEQASQARRIRDENANEIAALEAAIDNANDENDIAPLVGHFQSLQGQLATAGAMTNEGAYNSIMGPLQKKYQLRVRQIGLLPNEGGAGDEGSLAERMLRLGTLTGDEGLSKASNTLSGIFRSRALNQQTEALMNQGTQAAPLKEDKLKADTRLANERADAAAGPKGPSLADLDRLRASIERSMRNPFTGMRDVDEPPPADLVAEYNARAALLERPGLEFIGGRGLVEQDIIEDEAGEQHERQMNRPAPAARRSGTLGAIFGSGGAPNIPTVEDGPAPEAPPLQPQQQSAAPEPIVSGRALAQKLMAETGMSYEEAKARVRAAMAAQQGAAGANP